MEAQPPPADEFSKKAFFLDYGVIDVSEAHLCQYEGRCVKDPWCGEVFVAQNPWKPNDLVVHIAAIMIGAWVLSPSYVKQKEGACVQYYVGMRRPRQVLAYAGFKRKHAGVWRLILELVSKYKAKWVVLSSAEEWAAAKAATRDKPSVWALVDDSECDPTAHIFSLDSFVELLTPGHGPGGGHILKSCLGVGGM